MSTGIFRERLLLLRKRYRRQRKIRNGRDVSQGTPPFGKERLNWGFAQHASHQRNGLPMQGDRRPASWEGFSVATERGYFKKRYRTYANSL